MTRVESNAVTIDASAGGDYLSPMPKRNQPARESCISDLKANALDEKYSSKPSTQYLMDQFIEMYQEIEARLNKGLQTVKEMQLDNQIRASSNSFIGQNPQSVDATVEVLDLKAEMVSLKNKLFEAEQKKNEEIKAKQTRITQLEA